MSAVNSSSLFPSPVVRMMQPPVKPPRAFCRMRFNLWRSSSEAILAQSQVVKRGQVNHVMPRKPYVRRNSGTLLTERFFGDLTTISWPSFNRSVIEIGVLPVRGATRGTATMAGTSAAAAGAGRTSS